MEEKQISLTQLCALLWAGLMAPAAELLPAGDPAYRRAGGVAVRPGGPAGAAAPRLGTGQTGAAPRRAGGRHPLGAGAGIGAAGAPPLFYLGGAAAGPPAAAVRTAAHRLRRAGTAPLWFFLPAAALLVLWMARGKLPAFARAGQVFLAVLLTAAGAVLLLSLPQVRGEHLLPLWWGDACRCSGRRFRCWGCWATGSLPPSCWGIRSPPPGGSGTGRCGPEGAASCWGRSRR